MMKAFGRYLIVESLKTKLLIIVFIAFNLLITPLQLHSQ